MSRSLTSILLLLVPSVALAGWFPPGIPHRPTFPERAASRPAREEERGPTNWFMNQRRSVDGTLPRMARARALEEFRGRTESAAFVPGTWVNVGPRNIGGRVTALAVDPNAPAHLWLGAADGGVWSSSDAGTNWSSTFDAQTALSIGSIAVHPTDSNTVWVGTGEDNGGGYSYDGEGIFKTTNGGATWTNTGLSSVRRIGKIAVDPSNGQRVFAAAGGDWFHHDTNRGIYRTTDGGSTWQQVLYTADDTGGIDLAIDPSNPNRIYAALWQRLSSGTTWYLGGASSGIYRSLDGGTTWTRLTNGLPAGSGRIGLAIAPSSPSTVYACIINATGALDGVYRSTDSGDTWVKRSGTQQFSGYAYYFSQIRVDPTNVNTIYCLDVNLWRSLDGGATFAQVSSPSIPHVDWHALIVEASGRWLCGTDGGFFRSVNNGTSFFKAVTLPITQIYDLGICAPNPQIRLLGAQDNFSQRTLTGGASDWVAILGGDGLQCEIDPSNCNNMLASAQYGTIYRSTDGGTNMAVGYDGIGFERTNWNAPVILDPTNPSTVYSATYRMYRSTDFADNWVPISDDLSNGHPGGLVANKGSKDFAEDGDLDHLMSLIDGTITAIAVSKLDPQILWAGTDDGNVWVSTDAGGVWNQVNPPGTPYWVTDIEASRFDANTAYLTVTGYRNGDKLPYVRVTRNLGATWENLSAGLPQVPTNAILPSSVWRGRLFLGDDLGVLVSDDDGLTWSDMRSGLPYVVVMDLVENLASHTLFAATHARSIYTYDLNQLPVPDGDGDGVNNNADCALRDPGAFAVPGEAAVLTVEPGDIQLQFALTQDAVLSWTSLAGQAGNGTVYDIAYGHLASLTSSGTAGAAALACAVAATNFTDSTSLASGDGLYYLVRGRNSCGGGSWGRDSSGAERVINICP